MSTRSNHFPETLERPESSLEEFEAFAELSLRAAVSDLKTAGLSPTEIANIVSDVLFKKPEPVVTPTPENIPF